MPTLAQTSFAFVLRQILIVEKQRPVREVAEALGMKPLNFYARVHGRVSFRPGEINKLLRVLPDQRLIDCLLYETPFMAVERPTSRGWGVPETAASDALESAQQLLEAVRDINMSAAEGKLDRAMRAHIQTHVDAAEHALVRVRLAIPHLSGQTQSSTRPVAPNANSRIMVPA